MSYLIFYKIAEVASTPIEIERPIDGTQKSAISDTFNTLIPPVTVNAEFAMNMIMAARVLAELPNQRFINAIDVSSIGAYTDQRGQLGSQVTELNRCHIEFFSRLDSIIKLSDAQISNDLFDEMSTLIYNYDHCIDQAPNNFSDLFFNYSNILEAIFVAMKRRHSNISSAKNILTELEHIYQDIYSCFISGRCDNVSAIGKKLKDSEARAINEGLMPTVEECEAEMEETFAAMNDEEKEDLACLLRKN
jgi:hypothetical protein